MLKVDDNPDMFSFLKQYFSEGYAILMSENDEKALSIMREEKMDLVDSDVMKPGIGGIELCQRIKSDMQTSHVPVILYG